jgi:hypothetical protein
LDPASPFEPSSKALETSMKHDSESASEKEGYVNPKVVQAHKHPDALELSDLHETPLVESISESLSQERRDIGDSVSEAVVTDTMDVSGLGGETISEIVVLPPSTLVKEQEENGCPSNLKVVVNTITNGSFMASADFASQRINNLHQLKIKQGWWCLKMQLLIFSLWFLTFFFKKHFPQICPMESFQRMVYLCLIVVQEKNVNGIRIRRKMRRRKDTKLVLKRLYLNA